MSATYNAINISLFRLGDTTVFIDERNMKALFYFKQCTGVMSFRIKLTIRRTRKLAALQCITNSVDVSDEITTL